MEVFNDEIVYHIFKSYNPEQIKRNENRKLDNRIIEEIELISNGLCTNKALLKYGTEANFFCKEILFYDALSTSTLSTPKPINYGKLSNQIYYIAVERINGRHPEFGNESEVKKVFWELGTWASTYNRKIREYYNGNIDHFFNSDSIEWRSVFDSLIQDFNNIQDNMILLFSKVAQTAIEVTKDIEGIHLNIEETFRLLDNSKEQITKRIMEMPITLDKSDITRDNILINANQVSFIDFESIRICPISIMLSHIGEPWRWLPRNEYADLALKTFIDSWNNESDLQLNENIFLQSQICGRVYFKCELLEEWIRTNEIKDLNVRNNAIRYINELASLLPEINRFF